MGRWENEKKNSHSLKLATTPQTKKASVVLTEALSFTSYFEP